MPLTLGQKNVLLDATTITHISLHTSFPGTTGTNEVTGGTPAYARKALTWGAAASGSKANSGATLTFDVPAATTVQYLGFWSALTAGTYFGCAPLGGIRPIAGLAIIATDKIYAPAHGLANNDRICPTLFGATGALPTGLSDGTLYYVVGATTDDFQLSATQGGAAIDLTGAGSGPVQYLKVIQEVMGVQGTLSVAAAAVALDLNL